MVAAELAPVTNDRGDKIRKRRAQLGLSKAELVRAITERQGRSISVDAITAAENGTASPNTYLRVEAYLDAREDEGGYEPGEVLRAAEARDSPEEPEVMEFEVEGPSAKWRVHAKATKGNADEAIAAVAKLIHQLREDDGEAEES